MRYPGTWIPRLLLPAIVGALIVLGGLLYTVFYTPRIGLIVGHWQNDVGAICDDGLREVDITLAIAQQTAEELEKAGYRVDLLSEFDQRLSGYRALVLVSLHVDSCLPAHSGFKVARFAQSTSPEIEDALVECLHTEYEKATGLPRDPQHITTDMQEYHAFTEIALKTPAAIVELGYLGGDRELLTGQQETVSRGIAKGIRCFLETYLPEN